MSMPADITRSHAGHRVLVIGQSLAPDCMETHVIEGLRALGCIARCIDVHGTEPSSLSSAQRARHFVANILLREPERRHERQLLNAIRAFDPQLILVILGNQLSPKSVTAIRAATQAPVVCWCQDHLGTLGRQFLLGAGYDAVFVKDRYMQDLFTRMVRSTQFHYLPEACNPRVHRPIELTAADRERYACDVMIAGTLYYYRQEILRQLSEFDLRVYGSRPTWLLDRLPGRHRRHEVVLDEKVRAIRAARVALNTLHVAEVASLNCRAFEISGCGGFQLISANRAVAEHFIPGEEIETFDSVEELVEKTRHYLQHPDAAQAIAARGCERAHRDHTYEQRLQDILALTAGQGALS
jgi:spore maturation protein CgeB